MDIKIIFYIYVLFIALMSFFTMSLFIVDKRIAKNNSKDRIKEKTLLSFVAYGGAIGGFLGRIIARHKTDKIYFSIAIYVSLLLQIVTLVLLFLISFQVIHF